MNPINVGLLLRLLLAPWLALISSIWQHCKPHARNDSVLALAMALRGRDRTQRAGAMPQKSDQTEIKVCTWTQTRLDMSARQYRSAVIKNEIS